MKWDGRWVSEPDRDALTEDFWRTWERLFFTAADGTAFCRACGTELGTAKGHHEGCPVLAYGEAMEQLGATTHG